LKELNIAGNQIRYLPWELLDSLDGAGERRKVYIRPNPLVEPATISGPSTLPATLAGDAEEGLAALQIDCTEDFEAVRRRCSSGNAPDIRTELEMRLFLGRKRRSQHLHISSSADEEAFPCHEDIIYLASSDVLYFDVDGQPCRKSTEAAERYAAKVDGVESAPHSSSRAPSLFELVLKCAQAEYDLFNLPNELPLAVRTALDQAAKGLDYGNQACSTCERAFVIPRAEWMEYWFIGPTSQAGLTQDTVLPFLRKACSWTCATPTAVGTFRL
jgi:hypothetical protein